jgi:hypothetical protein
MYSRSRNNHAKNRTGRAGTDDALTQRARETKTAMSASQPIHPQQTPPNNHHHHPPQVKTAKRKKKKKKRRNR